MAEQRLCIEQMTAHLRHRAPFLFVDCAEISADQTTAWGTHTFAEAQPYFKGHFPDDPMVPGVIILEMLAQTANVLLSHRAGHQVSGYLVGLDDARFNQSVRPPSTVLAEVRWLREVSSGQAASGRITSFKASAYLEGKRCARSTVSIYSAHGQRAEP